MPTFVGMTMGRGWCANCRSNYWASTKGYEEPYQARRDNLPPGLADSASAGRLDEVLALRDLVDQLAAAELPKGFGRD
jgi:hypothetical protein